MGHGGYRLLLCVAAILAAVVCGPAAGATNCSTRLLADWRDGRVDRTYPVDCYRQALASLPEDLQVYSTAKSDLTRELQTQLDSPKKVRAGGVSHDNGGGVSAVLVLAVTAGLLLAGGSLATIAR